MRIVILTVLWISCFKVAFAQPTLTINNPIVSNTTWMSHRDITQPIFFSAGTGPNGWGDLAWASIAGDNTLNWNPAMAVDVVNCLNPWSQNAIQGTTPIWSPRQGCSTDPNSNNPQNDVVYLRRTFIANPSTACQYRLYIKADNETNVYVNGTYVGGTNNNWGSGTTFNIGNLLVNGLNVVAVQVSDDGVTGWMSLKISASCAAVQITPALDQTFPCAYAFSCEMASNAEGESKGSDADLMSCCRYVFSTTGVDVNAFIFKWVLECCDPTYTNCQMVHTSTGPTFTKDFFANYAYSGKAYRVTLYLTPTDGGAALPPITVRFRFSIPGCGLTIIGYSGEIDERGYLEQPADLNRVQVFPNPFNDAFTIQNNNDKGGIFEVSVYNQLAVLVKTTKVNLLSGEQFQIQAGDLPNGIYRVLVRDSEGLLKPHFFNIVKSE